MEDKHLKLKHRIAFGTAMGGFFCITLLVFAPLMLYVKGNDDMWFSFRTLLFPVALVGGISFIVLSAILSFVPKTIHKLLCCLTFGLALGFYLQCTFFNISYGSGVLDGSQIIWSDYTTYGAIDSAVWAGCIALPFALFMVFKHAWRHALMIAAGCIVLLQVGNLAINVYQNQSTLNKLSHEVTQAGIYDAADEENTMVFVLSSMDNSYYKAYKKAHPEVAKELTGFTQYDNTLATGAGTMVSLPALMTGEVYKKDTKYTDYIRDIWSGDTLYDLLQENAVDVRIFCDDMYFGNGAVRRVDNVVDRVQDKDSYFVVGSTVYRYTMYNCMPHYLKRFFWMNIKDYSSYKSNTTFTPFNDDVLYDNFKKNGGFSLAEKYHKSLRIYQLQGAREPYRLDHHGEKVSDGTSMMEQTEGEFKIILDMIRDLKQRGLYDKTRIVITADNGEEDQGQNPMLLYKDKGESKGYAISEAPISMFDLPATLASTVTKDYADYGTGMTFKDAEKMKANRERLFYRNAGSNAASRIEEYRCTGDASDVKNLEKISEYRINGGNVESYTLGEELTFTTDETAAIYCSEGFGHTNGWRTIIHGSRAVMEIPIDKIPENVSDLHAYFNVLTIYEKTPIVIYSNDEEIYRGELNSVVRQNGLNFLIPIDTLDRNVLRLEFDFPEIKDDSTNIMALTSFKIYNQ